MALVNERLDWRLQVRHFYSSVFNVACSWLQVKAWRIRLHKWNPEAAEGEEVVQVHTPPSPSQATIARSS